MRNAVPAPTFEEVHETGTERGLLKEVRPRGTAAKILAKVGLGINQVSVRAHKYYDYILPSQQEQYISEEDK
jgi:hypothetical protein